MVRLNLPKSRSFKVPAATWKRSLALLIDFIIIDFVIGSPFRNVINKLIPAGSFSQSYEYFSANPQIAGTLSLIMLLIGFLAILYFALLEFKINQTVGKIFMNIKVESDKKKLSFFACLIRSMYLIIMFPFVLLWILDPLFLLFNKDGRRLSEILSKTRTIESHLL